MKEHALAGLVLAIGIATAVAQPAPTPPPALAVATTNVAGPKIRFATPMYDFGRARAGEPVKYVYAFTNIGDDILTVANVQPQCGCTTAGEWTKQVEPGKTGSIPIQFNTANYNGPVFKQVTVTCNDKSQGTLFLQLRGTVYKPLEVNPQLAVLNLSPDSELASTIVTITNSTDEPLTLSEPESNNKAFKAELKTIAPGKGYQLVISSVPPMPSGGVQAQVNMKTSWTNPPVLSVQVYANVQPGGEQLGRRMRVRLRDPGRIRLCHRRERVCLGGGKVVRAQLQAAGGKPIRREGKDGSDGRHQHRFQQGRSHRGFRGKSGGRGGSSGGGPLAGLKGAGGG